MTMAGMTSNETKKDKGEEEKEKRPLKGHLDDFQVRDLNSYPKILPQAERAKQALKRNCMADNDTFRYLGGSR